MTHRRTMSTRQPERPGNERHRTEYDPARGGYYPPEKKQSEPEKPKDAPK
ncbi:hypothetical protein [Streptomyces sp. NPDC053560]